MVTQMDARVTAITEGSLPSLFILSFLSLIIPYPVLGYLRMVKLFGWEHHVQQKIAEKREHELERIWTMKLLGLCNNLVKSAPYALSL
jgi:ABC-type microcin C transport system permease subunit YejE